MTKYQCLSCLGIYESPQGDMEYFHICPDFMIKTKHAKDEVGAIKIELPNGKIYYKVPVLNRRDERKHMGFYSIEEKGIKRYYCDCSGEVKKEHISAEGNGKKIVESI